MNRIIENFIYGERVYFTSGLLIKNTDPPLFRGDIIRKAFEQLGSLGQVVQEALIEDIEQLGSNLNDDHYYSLKDIEQHLSRSFGENALHLLITMLEVGIEKTIESQRTMVPTSAEALCTYMLGISKYIRFAGIAGTKGELVAQAYRKGLSPLMNEREASLAVAHTIMCAETRRPLEKKLGRALFSYTLFENVKRVTIDIRTESDGMDILILSLDSNANHESIIMNEVLPFLDGLVLQNPSS